jgi:hypothetical protein
MIRGTLSRLLSFDDGCRGLCFVFMMVDKQMVPTQAGGGTACVQKVEILVFNSLNW